ncbi:PREDICTED: uncharacterized protein LOC109147872 [Ipomoea nil]|uniref:uncharacterized protein LOC109147872 n=1 Tax=Ipomoea nil TaxID=35883 RepID=UPI0009013DBE|nr:PREDICTED: uncharacterized protein LOC109147872 [Ipomoea nil]
MLSVRNEVEAVLGWRLTHGDVNLWWDNWSGLGILGRLYPFPGVEYSGDLLPDFIQNGELDLSPYDDLLPPGLEADMSRLGQRVADIPIWRVATDDLFSFSSAKSLLRPEPVHSDPLLSACWHKHLPFKVSFLAWRVLRGRLPTDDAMARFGHLIVSRCWCCNNPVRETIDHIFYVGDTARAVWGFFMGSLGLRFSHRGLRTLLTGWKRVVSRNRLVAFVVCRLPYLILWELWKHRNTCLHGRGPPSVPRVVYAVAKGVAECLFRRWPQEHILPPNWPVILSYIDSTVSRRVVRAVRWDPPPDGSIKLNFAHSESLGGTAALVRNRGGGFCYGLAISTVDRFRDFFHVMHRSLEWCLAEGFRSLVLESVLPELKGCVDPTTPTPWVFDSEVSRLRFLYSCASVSVLQCLPQGNLQVAALADWVGDKDGEFIFCNLSELPPRVRALLVHDDVPSVVFDDFDPP